MKILVIGNLGMLGRYIYSYLRQGSEDVVGLHRTSLPYNIDDLFDEEMWEDIVGDAPAVIINCVGIIKPRIKEVGFDETLVMNTMWPRRLAEKCDKFGHKFIHVSSDCCFSGRLPLGQAYDEMSEHDALDVYGKTKSLGEPETGTTIRTSIIGQEIGQHRSLISWVEDQFIKSKMNESEFQLNGYTNHYWNGVTCLELAKIIGRMIETNNYWKGVHHIYSPEVITKYQLLRMIVEEMIDFNLSQSVIPVEDKQRINRVLTSLYDKSTASTLKKQLHEMHKFYPILKGDECSGSN